MAKHGQLPPPRDGGEHSPTLKRQTDRCLILGDRFLIGQNTRVCVCVNVSIYINEEEEEEEEENKFL